MDFFERKRKCSSFTHAIFPEICLLYPCKNDSLGETLEKKLEFVLKSALAVLGSCRNTLAQHASTWRGTRFNSYTAQSIKNPF